MAEEGMMAKDARKMRLFKKYGYDVAKARKFILDRARLVPGKMLEVGTGRGHLAVALAKKGLSLESIDIDAEGQRIARMALVEQGLEGRVRLKRMDAEKLAYRSGSFDTVISVNFIHHAEDPEACVKEMVRVSAARVVIADINKNGERIMEKAHQLVGETHPRARVPLSRLKHLMAAMEMKVKVYRDTCQTVLVAEKGA